MWTPDPASIVTAEQRAAEVREAALDSYRAAIQAHVDGVARSRRYDNGTSLASYVASSNAGWAAEAASFVAWRDAVWAYAYVELDKVLTQQREQPTVEGLMAELPAMVWPT